MTSPNIGKPDQTNDKYDDVYARGSSFGADLSAGWNDPEGSEAKVRALLGQEIANPFAQFMQKIVNFGMEIVEGIADAITGNFPKAEFQVISGAVDERLGPIDSAITESGKRHLELAEKVDESIEKQEGYIEEARVALAEADSAISALEAEDARVKAEVTKLTVEATEATSEARRLAGEQAEINARLEEATEVANQGVLDAKASLDALNAYKSQQATVVNNLTAKADSAVKKADQGIADANKANTAITNLNSQFASKVEDQLKVSATMKAVNNQIAATGDAAASALSNADKAIDWLKNPTEIGSSLITYDPETGKPHWTKGLTVANAGNSMEYYYSTAGDLEVNGPMVKVDPRLEYRVSFEGYGYSSKSLLSMRFFDESDGPVSVDRISYETVDGKSVRKVLSSGTLFFLYRVELSQSWKKYEQVFKFEDGVDLVRLRRIQFNDAYREGIRQCIRNLRIEPIIPSQADVDTAQNLAIEANTEALKFQQWWNKNQETWNNNQESINKFNNTKWATQAELNKTNSNVNKAQDEAIEANAQAIKALNAPQLSSSILPLVPGTSTPTWQEGLRKLARGTYSEPDKALPEGYGYYYTTKSAVAAGKYTDVLSVRTNLVSVDSRLEYEATWWVRASNANTEYIYLTLADQDGSLRSVQKVPGTDLDSSPSRYTWGNPIRAIINKPSTEWQKFTTRFKFKEGTTGVRVYGVMFSNATGSAAADMFMTGLEVSPRIPTQASVDAAQNQAIEANTEAIKAQKEINEKQKLIDAAQDEATSANTRAIKALGRIDIGGSLLPYQEPSDSEVQNGTAVYDKPDWWRAGHVTAGPYNYSGDIAVVKYSAGALKTQGTKQYRGPLVKADPGTKYKFGLWAYADADDSALFIELRDQDGNHAVKSGTIGNSSSSYLVGDLRVKRGWNWYETVIELRPGVEEVRLASFYWNHPNGSAKANQYVANMVLQPDIPTQADVDKAQNLAIEANTKFTEEQKRINRLTQVQLWQHQDMLEQVDIRTPKTWGWAAGAYNSKTVCPYSVNTSKVPYTNYSPYFETWEFDKSVYVACKGTWVGAIEADINWDNGALDHWVFDITDTDRVFRLSGGAMHIDKRYLNFTVFPKSLMRKCWADIEPELTSPGSMNPYSGQLGSANWWRVQDTNGLYRVKYRQYLRLKNVCTCDRNVNIRDEDGKLVTIKAGQPIPSTTIYPEDQAVRSGRYNFYEVGDPAGSGYSVPNARAATGNVKELQA